MKPSQNTDESLISKKELVSKLGISESQFRAIKNRITFYHLGVRKKGYLWSEVLNDLRGSKNTDPNNLRIFADGHKLKTIHAI